MRKWLPLLTVCLGTFMLLVDVTIVNVALPDLTRSLRASFTALQWVIDAYALVLAALLLGVGSLADRLGHLRTYVAGLAVFAASSLACGLAGGPAVLIAARAVQGVGAAAMFATTFALLNCNYRGRDRGTAYGLWGAVAGASAATGPVLGGLLTQAGSWRWIFFVNLPVSVLAIGLARRAVTDQRHRTAGSIDLPGLVSFTLAAGAATFAFIRAADHGWTNRLTLIGVTVAVTAGIVFVAVEFRCRTPLLDLRLATSRTLGAVLLAALTLNLAAFAFFPYVSIWLQSILGLTPLQAGLSGLPMSIASFAVSASIGRYLHGQRVGIAIAGGTALIGAGGLIGSALIHDGTASWPQLLPGFLVTGVGVGLATPSLSSAGMAAVPPERGGMAAGAVNTARQLGFAFGIALLGSAFTSRAAAVLTGHDIPRPDAVASALAAGQYRTVLDQSPIATRSTLQPVLRDAAAQGIHTTLLIAGIAGLVIGALLLALLHTKRAAADPAPAHHHATADTRPTA